MLQVDLVRRRARVGLAWENLYIVLMMFLGLTRLIGTYIPFSSTYLGLDYFFDHWILELIL